MARYIVPDESGNEVHFEIAGQSPTDAERQQIKSIMLQRSGKPAPPPPPQPDPGSISAGLHSFGSLFETVGAKAAYGLGASGVGDTLQDWSKKDQAIAAAHQSKAFTDIKGISDVPGVIADTAAQAIPWLAMGALDLTPAAPLTLPMTMTAMSGWGLQEQEAATGKDVKDLTALETAKAVGTGIVAGQMQHLLGQASGLIGKTATGKMVVGAAEKGFKALGVDAAQTAAAKYIGQKGARVLSQAAFGSAFGATDLTLQTALMTLQADPDAFFRMDEETRTKLMNAGFAGGLFGGSLRAAHEYFSDGLSPEDRKAKLLENHSKIEGATGQRYAAAAQSTADLRAAGARYEAEAAQGAPMEPGSQFGESSGPFRYEPIVTENGNILGHKVVGPDGQAIPGYERVPTAEQAQDAAAAMNTKANYSDSFMDATPIIPLKSLSPESIKAIEKARFEEGEEKVSAPVSLSDLRKYLGEDIAKAEWSKIKSEYQAPKEEFKTEPFKNEATPGDFEPGGKYHSYMFRDTAPGETPVAEPDKAPERNNTPQEEPAAAEAKAAEVVADQERASQKEAQDKRVEDSVKREPIPTIEDLLQEERDPEPEPDYGYEEEMTGERELDPTHKYDLDPELEDGPPEDIQYSKRGKDTEPTAGEAEEETPQDEAPEEQAQPGGDFTVDAVPVETVGADKGPYEVLLDGKRHGPIHKTLEGAQKFVAGLRERKPTARVQVRPKNHLYGVWETKGTQRRLVKTFRDKAAAEQHAKDLASERAAKAVERDSVMSRLKKMDENRAQAGAEILDYFAKLGAPKLGVFLKNLIRDGGELKTGIEGAAGNTDKMRFVLLALDIYGPDISAADLVARLKGVVNHEFIHILENSGALSDTEIPALKKAAKVRTYKNSGLTYYERAEQMYPEEPPEVWEKEAIAEMFRDWMEDPRNVTGQPATLFRRVMDIIRRIGEYLKGTRVEERIMRDIRDGKYGDKIPDALTAEEITKAFPEDELQYSRRGYETRLNRETGESEDRISTRFPTLDKSPENPLTEKLTINRDAMRAAPDAYEHNAQIVKNYPGFKTKATTADGIYDDFHAFVKDNLKFLYDNTPDSIKNLARVWYEGANNITHAWAKQFDVPDHTVAGVLAALSPQKDWYQNVSLGERVLDIHTRFTRGNMRDFAPDAKMKSVGKRIYAKEQYADALKNVLKSRYEDLPTEVEKAMWLRIYDEAHNPRGFREVSPDGRFIGKPKGNVAWGSNVQIAKAIYVLTHENIHETSKAMGEQHKVRNFFNNILAPNSSHGDVTIDTHAVAAALLRPLSGSSTEVYHNFGTGMPKDEQGADWAPVKNAGVSGAKGTYGLYADAYRDLAKELGIHPRELQSITWEAVRGLYPAVDKRSGPVRGLVSKIWEDVKSGKISAKQGRQKILKAANGINPPSWVGSDREGADASKASSYEGELARNRLSGEDTGGRGVGGLDAAGDQGPEAGRGSGPASKVAGQRGAQETVGSTGRSAREAAAVKKALRKAGLTKLQYSVRGVRLEDLEKFHLVRANTPEFKKFFKNSDAKDEKGNPRVLFHGTWEDFTQFETQPTDIGFHVGSEFASNDLLDAMWRTVRQKLYGTGDRPRLIPLFASIQKPLELPDIGKHTGTSVWNAMRESRYITPDQWHQGLKRAQGVTKTAVINQMKADFGVQLINSDFNAQAPQFSTPAIARKLFENGHLDADSFNKAYMKSENRVYADMIKDQGYDGIKYVNTAEGTGKGSNLDSVSYAVFDSNQLKSIFNEGAFSEKPNIMKSVRGVSPEAERKVVEDLAMKISEPSIRPVTHEIAQEMMKGHLRRMNDPEFLQFFKGSKVIRDLGNGIMVPDIQFHASIHDFDTFKYSYVEAGIHVGTISQAADFYKPKKSGAENYRIMPLFVAIRNPLVTLDMGRFTFNNIVRELTTGVYGGLPEAEARVLEEADNNLRREYQAASNPIAQAKMSELIEQMFHTKLPPEKMSMLGIDMKDAEAIYKKLPFKLLKQMNFHHPVDLQYHTEQLASMAWSHAARELLKSLGYDGLKYKNTGEGLQDPNRISYMALEPTQLKSVFNGGKFDIKNPSIMKSVRGTAEAEGFRIPNAEWWPRFEENMRDSKIDPKTSERAAIKARLKGYTPEEAAKMVKAFGGVENFLPEFQLSQRGQTEKKFNDPYWEIPDNKKYLAKIGVSLGLKPEQFTAQQLLYADIAKRDNLSPFQASLYIDDQYQFSSGPLTAVDSIGGMKNTLGFGIGEGSHSNTFQSWMGRIEPEVSILNSLPEADIYKHGLFLKRAFEMGIKPLAAIRQLGNKYPEPVRPQPDLGVNGRDQFIPPTVEGFSIDTWKPNPDLSYQDNLLIMMGEAGGDYFPMHSSAEKRAILTAIEDLNMSYRDAYDVVSHYNPPEAIRKLSEVRNFTGTYSRPISETMEDFVGTLTASPPEQAYELNQLLDEAVLAAASGATNSQLGDAIYSKLGPEEGIRRLAIWRRFMKRPRNEDYSAGENNNDWNDGVRRQISNAINEGGEIAFEPTELHVIANAAYKNNTGLMEFKNAIKMPEQEFRATFAEWRDDGRKRAIESKETLFKELDDKIATLTDMPGNEALKRDIAELINENRVKHRLGTTITDPTQLMDLIERASQIEMIGRDLVREVLQMHDPEKMMQRYEDRPDRWGTPVADRLRIYNRMKGRRYIPSVEEFMLRTWDRVRINTPQFQAFFENSHAVDLSGDPRVLFHGTVHNFGAFTHMAKDLGWHFGTRAQAHNIVGNEYSSASYGYSNNAKLLPVYLSIQNPLRLRDVGTTWKGQQVLDGMRERGLISEDEQDALWRLVNRATHDIYADRVNAKIAGTGINARFPKQDVIDANKANLFGGNNTYDEMSKAEHKALEVSKKFGDVREKVENAIVRKLLNDMGYDGIVYRNTYEGQQTHGPQDSYLVFNPGQIKSLYNNGAFRRTNRNIMKSQRGTYYHKPTIMKFKDLEEFAEKPGGSAAGGIYKHVGTGEKWLVKWYPEEDQASSEVAANALYRIAGLDAPDMKLVYNTPGGMGVASKWIEKSVPIDRNNPKHIEAIRKGFGIDAFLGNWDVIGLEFDNIRFKDGVPYRVDTGGSLDFRAMGERKGDRFGSEVTEIDTLKNPAINAQAAEIFFKMSDADIAESLNGLRKISDETIIDVMNDAGIEDEHMAERLIARKNFLLAWQAKVGREKVPAGLRKVSDHSNAVSDFRVPSTVTSPEEFIKWWEGDWRNAKTDARRTINPSTMGVRGKSVMTDHRGNPQRWYNGNNGDYKAAKPGWSFYTLDPKFANDYTGFGADGGRMLPVYLSVQKPFDISKAVEFEKLKGYLQKNIKNRADLKEIMGEIERANTIAKNYETRLKTHLLDKFGPDWANHPEMSTLEMGAIRENIMAIDMAVHTNWHNLEHHPGVSKFINENGYDGFYIIEGGLKNIAVLNAGQAKSVLNPFVRGEARKINYSRRGSAQLSMGSHVQNHTPADIQEVMDRLFYTSTRDFVQKYLMSPLARITHGKDKAEEKGREWANFWVDGLGDSFLPVGEMIDIVRKNNGKLTDAMDPYMQEQFWQSKADKVIKSLKASHYRPALDAIRDLKFDKNDIDALEKVAPMIAKVVRNAADPRNGFAAGFMYTMHAPERNSVIAARQRNLKAPNLAGSGVTNAEAAAALRWFKAHGDYRQMQMVSGKLRDIIKETNRLRQEYGLIKDPAGFKYGTEFQLAGLPNGYEYYAPLRGMLDEDLDPDLDSEMNFMVSRGLRVKGKEDMHALGRDKLAGNIVEHIMIQNQMSVLRGEKASVGRALHDLVKDPTNSAMLSEWITLEKRAPMHRVLTENGTVRYVPDQQYRNSKEYFITKVDGDEVIFKIKNKRLMESLNRTPMSEGWHKALDFVGGYTRMLAKLSTGYNPEFMLSNIMKDIQDAGININQFEQKGLTKDIMSNWLEASKAIGRSNPHGLKYLMSGVEGEYKGAEPMDITLKEFVEDGGLIGYMGTATLEDTIKKVNQDLTPHGESMGAKGIEAMRRFGDMVEGYNGVLENATRLSVYKTLRDRGVSRDKAAWAAKNMTTNFQKGGLWKAYINPLYMFFNAGIQGQMGLIAAGMRSPKVRKIILGIIAGGMLNDFIQSQISQRDKNGRIVYDQIPDHVKATHMVFMDPFGITSKGYISIPMPYGYNAFYDMGRTIGAVARSFASPGDGPTNAANAALNSAGVMIDAFNPMGGTGSFLNFVMPTVLDPVVDLSTNRGWNGNPVYKESSGFGPPVPQSQLFWSNTSPSAQWVAQTLHDLSGGDKDLPGMVEVSPDALQYLYDFSVGGAGAFARRLVEGATTTLPNVLSGDIQDLSVGDIPFIRKFAGNVSTRVDTEQFIQIRDRVMSIQKNLQDTAKDGNIVRVKSLREEYQKELRAYGPIAAANNQRNQIARQITVVKGNSHLKPEAKEQLLKNLRTRQLEAEQRAVTAYNVTVLGLTPPPKEEATP